MFRGNQNDRGQGGLTSVSTPPTHSGPTIHSGAPLLSLPKPPTIWPSNIPCPCPLLLSGSLMPRPGKPHSGLFKGISCTPTPLVLCSHGSPNWDALSNSGATCAVTLSHLSIQREALTWQAISTLPKDMPPSVRMV